MLFFSKCGNEIASKVSLLNEREFNRRRTAYGLGGCGSANEGEVKKDNRDIYRICRTGNWIWSSELEYANYQ